MNFKELKIGYVPYSTDLSQPADRRRFPYFAKRKEIEYEIADTSKKYDLIILPAPANLSKWLLYKRKNPETRFIFEMVDSLIFRTDFFSGVFKGIGRFLVRKETLMYFNYQRLIIKWIKTADLVLCSSTEIRSRILHWNRNALVSLDYLENEYSSVKQDYTISGKMKLVWEGQGSVLPHFLHFKTFFEQINSFCELHIITSKGFALYGRYLKKDISKILDQLPIKTIFHEWDINTKDKILSQCDCGIIPLNKDNIFGWHKPANKLISFWFTGLPTLVSDTPAYKELMDKALERMYCENEEDWIKKIHIMRNMEPSDRMALAAKNLAHVKRHYSDVALDKVWGNIFSRLDFLYENTLENNYPNDTLYNQTNKD